MSHVKCFSVSQCHWGPIHFLKHQQTLINAFIVMPLVVSIGTAPSPWHVWNLGFWKHVDIEWASGGFPSWEEFESTFIPLRSIATVHYCSRLPSLCTLDAAFFKIYFALPAWERLTWSLACFFGLLYVSCFGYFC